MREVKQERGDILDNIYTKCGRKNSMRGCECKKLSYIWLWAVLFLVVLFICMVEW